MRLSLTTFLLLAAFAGPTAARAALAEPMAAGASFAESAAGKAAVSDSAAGPAVKSDAAVTPLTREHFIALLAHDLSAHFRLEGDLQIELLRSWTPPAGAAVDWTLDVLEYPQQAVSSMLVRCRLAADGVAAGEMTLVCRASHYREVWVTRQPLEVGAVFDPTMLDTRRVDVFRERDVVPTGAGDRNYVFSRAISGGRLLTWHDVARRPLVRKGQVVEVSAVDGMLSITMKALALENGAQGDLVTVRNPESRKDFSAVVIDENHVQVHF